MINMFVRHPIPLDGFKGSSSAQLETAMINYSKRLGENMFDRLFPTTPGRVDPSTGMFVMTDQISLPELRAMAEERRTRGRGYDRGEDRGGRSQGEEFRRGESTFPRMRSEFEGMRRPGMSGPGETTPLLQNPAFWLIVGTGILIALESNGITHLSKA